MEQQVSTRKTPVVSFEKDAPTGEVEGDLVEFQELSPEDTECALVVPHPLLSRVRGRHVCELVGGAGSRRHLRCERKHIALGRNDRHPCRLIRLGGSVKVYETTNCDVRTRRRRSKNASS